MLVVLELFCSPIRKQEVGLASILIGAGKRGSNLQMESIC